MVELLIIADDLTGANDTAVQFARRGVPVFVTLETTPDLRALGADYNVVAIDTESRHLEVTQAARRVREAASHARSCGVERFYKKTDSTLRGNIGAELDALLGAVGGGGLAYVPAFPRAGRTVRKGYVYVDSVPVHETAFGDDPLCPVPDSYVPDVVGRQSWRPVRLVGRGDYAAGPGGDPAAITVYDAASDDDLAAIGESLRSRGMPACLAGPAGFAELLPALLELPRRQRKPRSRGSRLLIVCGSVHQASLRQTNAAIQQGAVRLVLSPENVHNPGGTASFIEPAVRLLEGGSDVIVTGASERDDVDRFRRAGLPAGLNGAEVSSRVAQYLGAVAAAVVERLSDVSLVCFGGDTSLAVVQALRCSGVVPLDEIGPGTTLCEAVRPGGTLTLVTKSGGFGPPDAVQQIKAFLETGSGTTARAATT